MSHIYYSAQKLLEIIAYDKEVNDISDAAILAEIELTGKTKDYILEHMEKRLDVMRESIQVGLKEKNMSFTRMVNKEATKMNAKIGDENMLMSTVMQTAVTWSLAVMQSNACMGRIVASPTAGSAGVVPACLLAVEKHYGLKKEDTVRGLLAAAGLGTVIGKQSTFAAAQAGCQAEIGTSVAMAACGISEMRGMSPAQAIDAASLGLKNLLGLACDPIGGLVEVPCVKRNAIAVSVAMTASDLSYAGIESYVPFDEILVAMNNIGASMSRTIKETALGGLAITETGMAIKKKLNVLKNR